LIDEASCELLYSVYLTFESTDVCCRRINILAVCHKHKYESYCGAPAAGVMDVLLRRALNDPVFLRYGYRPHCASHTTTHSYTTPAANPPSSPTLTTSEPFSSVELTTEDRVENSTVVTTETAGSRHRQTGEQFEKSDCVTLNVSIVASLAAVLALTLAI